LGTIQEKPSEWSEVAALTHVHIYITCMGFSSLRPGCNTIQCGISQEVWILSEDTVNHINLKFSNGLPAMNYIFLYIFCDSLVVQQKCMDVYI
jgi:hypothetical protein